MRYLLIVLSLLGSMTAAYAQNGSNNGNGNNGILNGIGNGNGSGNTISNSFRQRGNAPAVSAPGLAAGGSDVCLGSISFGASGVGFGLSFGTTTPEHDCNIRQYSRLLSGLGHRRAATQMLCFNREVAQALAAQGTPCLVGESAATAAPVVTRRPARRFTASGTRQYLQGRSCQQYDIFRGCLDGRI